MFGQEGVATMADTQSECGVLRLDSGDARTGLACPTYDLGAAEL